MILQGQLKMNWKQYGKGKFEAVDREFWDARDGDVSAHVLRLGDKWCAYAAAPSKYGDPAVNHGRSTDFIFQRDDRSVAMAKAEVLAAEARISWDNEKPRR